MQAVRVHVEECGSLPVGSRSTDIFRGWRSPMEITVLMCNCKGLCDSFKDSDMNTLPFEVESDLDVKYAILSPQLCGQGRNAVLEEAMKASGPNSYLLVGACAPKAQEKLFEKLIRATGFNEKHFIPVDIPSTDNKGIVDRLREAVEGILKPKEATPATI